MRSISSAQNVLLLMVLTMTATVARAETPEDDAARARVHFTAGRSYYDLGQFADALREFEAGYLLAPRPRFLLNMGHCYRKLKDFVHARDTYRRFLAGVSETDSDRAEARLRLTEVEDALAKEPPPESPSTQPPPTAIRTTAVSQTAPLSATAPEAPRRSKLRHLAWTLPLAAVVVAGVALGVYFGTRPGACSGSTLACIHAMP
jgi:tetratricopeptide (TPR) repeat protein